MKALLPAAIVQSPLTTTTPVPRRDRVTSNVMGPGTVFRV